ncbi:hypothetical protein HGRIS_003994 [Hohenbuehelia grisea]|uniref:Ankyrin n=1 Tax=Hohenbuehelia grisea TaxID=104357 RepID=A0ABR3JHC1_9AGAR
MNYAIGTSELHTAALAGDFDAFSTLLASGADINALDTEGSTVLMCAIAGTDWRTLDASDASFMTPGRLRIIQTIIEHPDASLYTLNAPHRAMNGVTPLGMASWLNYPSVVRTLVEDSKGTVSVNGADGTGVTALMYAARDGGVDVGDILISNGARPDFRDRNHRTSTQFALPHPQMLWLCENALRRHRSRESQNPEKCRLAATSTPLLPLLAASLSCESVRAPSLDNFAKDTMTRLTNSLVRAIITIDLKAIHSLLFPAPVSPPALSASLTIPPPASVADSSPRNSTICLSWPSPPSFLPPVLVNRLDRGGWAPVHHCAAAPYPSITVLDALYCAGADVSLFTDQEHYSPLHCFARYARVCERPPSTPDSENSDISDPALHLYRFAVHLVRDLQAPLSARDKDGETPLHVAAEHGASIDVLAVLLELDTARRVCALRNARGLTPLEVAQPHFRLAFGAELDALRPQSALSTRTVRPLHPTASLSSIASVPECPATPTPGSTFASRPALTVDCTISPELPAMTDDEAVGAAHVLLANLRMPHPYPGLIVETARLARAIVRHHNARVASATRGLDALRASVARIRTSKMRVDGLVHGELVRRGVEALPLPSALREARNRNRDSDDSQMTAVSLCVDCKADAEVAGDGAQDAARDQNQTPVDSDMANDATIASAVVPLPAFADSPHSSFVVVPNTVSGANTPEPDILQSSEPARVIRRKTKSLFKRKASDGTARWTTWLRRKTKSEDGESPPASAADEEVPSDEETVAWDGSPVDELTPELPPSPIQTHARDPTDTVLCSANILLATASKDLRAIEQSLDTAEIFLQSTAASISRAERVIGRTLKKLEAVASIRPPSSATPYAQPPTSSPPSAFSSPDTSPIVPTRACVSLSARPRSRWRTASDASLFTIPPSARSSCVDLPTPADTEEDQDTRMVRRLLLRKIDAGLEGALAEIDRMAAWLPIAREAVFHIKRRCYL